MLPDLPLKIIAPQDAKANFDRNYRTAWTWASFAIQHHYRIPYWELGNEIEKLESGPGCL